MTKTRPPRTKLTAFIIMLKANDCPRDNNVLFNECLKYASNAMAKISDRRITIKIARKNGNTNQTIGSEIRFASTTDCRTFFFGIFFLAQYINATINSKAIVMKSARINVTTLWALKKGVVSVIVAAPLGEMSRRYVLQ